MHRRVLVVGGGQTDIGQSDSPIGNGRAICLLLAREGAAVAVADRDLSSAEETVARIDSQPTVAIQADVTNESDIETMVATAHRRLAGLDGLVLNVGIGASAPWLQGMSAADWNTVLAVNLTSHALVLKHALPILDQGASIVFISSVAGLRPGSRLPAYDASKAGLIGLCRHTAFEGARREIRANVVAPGLMDTPLGRLASRGRPSRDSTRIPLGRQGTGWETAYLVLFLISNESAYITGQLIAVDGGLATVG